MSKKRTLILSKDTYLYLFNLCSENYQKLKEAEGYSEEDCKNYNWMREGREKARNSISLAKRLCDAVLFGEDEDA